MPLYYQSGEEVKKGDKVLYAEKPGEIEFVADPVVIDPATKWYVEEYGGGVMVSVPNHFGSVFSRGLVIDDEIEFMSRGE
ncbi:MAG: hypothetical protein ACLPM3_03475 [Terracidiphilus sp.]